jgi:hypothetical protein
MAAGLTVALAVGDDGFFGDNIAIVGKHCGSLGVDVSDLAHEASVRDAVAFFFFGSVVAFGIAMVPLGSHDAPVKGDEFAGPDVPGTAASIEFHCMMVAVEEGLLELTPFFEQATLKELGPAIQRRLEVDAVCGIRDHVHHGER